MSKILRVTYIESGRLKCRDFPFEMFSSVVNAAQSSGIVEWTIIKIEQVPAAT